MPPGGFAIWNDGAAAADAAIGGTFPRRGSDGTMAPMNEPQGKSRRQRLQALLSIPEKERTEVQWDEINELEIGLASGNRSEGAEHHQPSRGPGGAPNPPRPGGGPNPPRPGGDGQGRKQFKKFRKRPPNRGAP
jgi:hypothetical protein